MKHILYLIAILTFGTNSHAQISWDNAAPDTVFKFETNPDVEVHNKISFTDSGTYRWVRTFDDFCGVTNAVCDKNTCYLETVDSALFFVEKGESFPFIIHFYPNNKCCKYVKAVLRVYKVSDPSVNSSAEYNIGLWCSSASNQPDLSNTSIQIYPNPSFDFLQISSSYPVTEMQILDYLGRDLTKEASLSNNKIDVSALSAGHYFVSLSSNGILYKKAFVKN